jgi:nucleoside-diphosphate-sugar epimerase
MHPNDGRVVSNFIVQALKNQDITVYGDGTHTRSFCYVDDLVDGLVRLMGTPHDVTGPVNLGNPGEFTIRELAQSIIDLIGSSSRIIHMPLPAEDISSVTWGPTSKHMSSTAAAAQDGRTQNSTASIRRATARTSPGMLVNGRHVLWAKQQVR